LCRRALGCRSPAGHRQFEQAHQDAYIDHYGSVIRSVITGGHTDLKRMHGVARRYKEDLPHLARDSDV
jgi:hypothetical protein